MFRNFWCPAVQTNPGCSHIFLVLFEAFWYNQMSKYGVPGLRKSRNHEHVKFLCVKIWNRYFIIPIRSGQKPIQLLNLLSEYNSTIKRQNMIIIIMIVVPMVFLLFSYRILICLWCSYCFPMVFSISVNMTQECPTNTSIFSHAFQKQILSIGEILDRFIWNLFIGES